MLRPHRWLLLFLLSTSVGCLLPAPTTWPDSPQDGEISSRVEGRLAADEQGGLSDMLVTTEHGTVTLTGTVQRAERKAKAAELARQVPGVRRVKNDLEIRATSAP